MHEAGGQRQVGRILGLLGDLLRETGRLVGEEVESRPEAGGSMPPAREGAPEPGEAGETSERSETSGGEPLFLVCVGPQGPVAFPWRWVAETRLDAEGSALSLRIADERASRELALGRVIGLMTLAEIAARVGSIHQFFSAEELVERLGKPVAAAPRPATAESPIVVTPPAEDVASGSQAIAAQKVDGVAPQASPAPAVSFAPIIPEAAKRVVIAESLEQPVPKPAAPATAVVPEPVPPPSPPALPEQVCIVSPSALARRFLMRHLCELGYEVLEARDLDDPLLPADLRGVTALFLDESLQDDWASRPAAGGGLPLVLLTVDGELSVPRNGDHPPRKAVLPRPFERAEVERVVHWLRSLATGGAGDRGSGDHGSAQDDTWLFADPFGPAGAREHSRR